jgi:hypothetical protein
VQQAALPPAGVKQGPGPSHNMHAAASAGFGVWGMAPTGPQLWEQQYPGHSLQYPAGHVVMTQAHSYMPPDAWAAPADGTHYVQPGRLHPGSPQQQQAVWQAPAGATDAAAAAETADSSTVHVGPVVDPAGAGDDQASPDSNPSDNLVMAVLQEISRQQQS